MGSSFPFTKCKTNNGEFSSSREAVNSNSREKLESLALRENTKKLIKSEKKTSLMMELLSTSIQEKEVSLECPVCLDVAQAPIFTCEVRKIELTPSLYEHL